MQSVCSGVIERGNDQAFMLKQIIDSRLNTALLSPRNRMGRNKIIRHDAKNPLGGGNHTTLSAAHIGINRALRPMRLKQGKNTFDRRHRRGYNYAICAQHGRPYLQIIVIDNAQPLCRLQVLHVLWAAITDYAFT